MLTRLPFTLTTRKEGGEQMGKKRIKECENQNSSSAKETVFYICDGVVLLPSLGEMRWGRRYLFWGK
jgi:hypothetical protein